MKRAVANLLIPLLLASWLSTGFLRGDVSGNGRVDLADAILAVKNLTAAAEDAHTGRLLRSSLGSAIHAFRTIAGLIPEIDDGAKKGEVVKAESLLLALIPHVDTSPYQPSSLIPVTGHSSHDSITLDLPTPHPELV